LITFHLFLVLTGNSLAGQIKVVDLAGDYINYYHVSQQVSDEQNIQNFNRLVFQKAPKVYESIFNDIKWIGQNPEERILAYHKAFKPIETKYSELSDTLPVQLKASLRSFQEVFPDFNSGFEVYILHSLGIRAGGVVCIASRDILMFGADQIAKYFDFHDFSPFFHHELTHLYHNMHYAPTEDGDYTRGALYNHIWREGLAVYMSAILNPNATQKEVFMKDSLPQQTKEVLDIAIPEIQKNLYSSDKEMIRKYFWNSSTDPVIPQTAGYYIGYMMVAEIAKKYSLDELVKLKEEDFIPGFELILEKGIDCTHWRN